MEGKTPDLQLVSRDGNGIPNIVNTSGTETEGHSIGIPVTTGIVWSINMPLRRNGGIIIDRWMAGQTKIEEDGLRNGERDRVPEVLLPIIMLMLLMV